VIPRTTNRTVLERLDQLWFRQLLPVHLSNDGKENLGDRVLIWRWASLILAASEVRIRSERRVA
jgi:hypothetical protein